MMPSLHDSTYRAAIQNRLQALRADSQRKWGKMTVDQMLWHVNEALESALGRISLPPERSPLPRPIMKFIVINLPWPKGAPTLPDWRARGEHDFNTERSRCLRLVDELASTPLDGHWPDSPVLGRMTGRDVTRLHAKHLNHHLTQFGV
jgi:hypothetical protein